MDPHVAPTSHPKILQAGLELLSTFQPELAAALHEEHGQPHFVANETQPEAIEWFKSLKLENAELIYVYGIGNGRFYQAAADWLRGDSERNIVFIEDDPAQLQRCLSIPENLLFLGDLQVDIQWIKNPSQPVDDVDRIYEDNSAKRFIFTAHPAYRREREDEVRTLGDLFQLNWTRLGQSRREYADFGVLFFHNFYRNLYQLPAATAGDLFFDEFKGVPAIICGAAPSLNRQIPLLESIKDQAILFGPGSSINILTSNGIFPHFGVNIDPTIETFHRQYMQRGFEVPVFYRNRIYHEALKTIHGPHLFLAGSLYKATDWFEKELDLSSNTIMGGFSVIHNAIDIAMQMGCNPIILVGMSLSIPEQAAHYGKGVERHPLFPVQVETKSFLGTPVYVKDIHGDTVKSYWTWILEAQWIEAFARTYPDVDFINSTEEGIGFFSIPNIPFEEVINSHLKTQHDVTDRIGQLICEAGTLPLTDEKIDACLRKFYDSLTNCKKHIQTLLRNLREHGDLSVSFDPIIDEPAYQYLLQEFDLFVSSSFNKDVRMVTRIQDPLLAHQRHAQLIENRLFFLLHTVSLHQTMIEQSMQEYLSMKGKVTSIADHIPEIIHDASLERKIRKYPSGQIYSEQWMDAQQRLQGTHRYFYPDGKLKTILTYKDSLLDGPVILYNPHGQKKRELHFKANEREGVERSWYPNGSLYTEVVYQNSIPLTAKCWDPAGQLVKDITL